MEFGQLLSTTTVNSLLGNGNGSRIAIREELTAYSQNLFKEMRQSQDILKIKYCGERSGHVRQAEESRETVDYDKDFLFKKRGYPLG